MGRHIRPKRGAFSQVTLVIPRTIIVQDDESAAEEVLGVQVKSKEEKNVADLDGDYEIDVELELREVLHALADCVSEPFFSLGMNGDFSMCTFETTEVEKVINELGKVGIGSFYGDIAVTSTSCSHLTSITEMETKKKTAASSFKDSIRARLTVEQVAENVGNGAKLTFDYLAFVVVAAVIAAVGLCYNSTVSVVASMLVSPIMGPIMGFTFGTVIRDTTMVLIGLKNELISLFLCILVGFVYGFLIAVSGTGPRLGWPTSEMYGRGDPDNLIVGVAIAVPSGIGVALSILSNNANSLVGVAISASLLPPAINSGMLWAYAAFAPSFTTKEDLLRAITTTQVSDSFIEPGSLYPALVPERLNCFPIKPSSLIKEAAFGIENITSVVDQDCLVYRGCISLALTMVNIGCIFLVAILTFKIKEVSPIPGKSKFWSVGLDRQRSHARRLRHGTVHPAEMGPDYIHTPEEPKVRYHKVGHLKEVAKLSGMFRSNAALLPPLGGNNRDGGSGGGAGGAAETRPAGATEADSDAAAPAGTSTITPPSMDPVLDHFKSERIELADMAAKRDQLRRRPQSQTAAAGKRRYNVKRSHHRGGESGRKGSPYG